MHIQVINFNLEGINRAEYEVVCDELAGAFAALPGLISKHWVADEENNIMVAFMSGKHEMPMKRI